MKIKILTYNIRGARGLDGKRDFRRIGLFLKSYGIDIALIQELNTLPSTRDTEKDIADLQTDHFTSFIAAPTVVGPHGWYGNAVMSRFPIVKHNIIDISTTNREPRNILEVFIETPSGQLHVVNTHKGLGFLERNQQMAKLNQLLGRKSEIPLVVGGDINEWQKFSAGLKKLNQALHPLPTGPTFPTLCPFFRLDRMWCRPQGLVTTSKVVNKKEIKFYSDHYPVLAEVEI